MENIRKYCEYIDLYFQISPNQEKQNEYYKEKDKCLDAISNKLLSIDSKNKEYYAKMIAYYLENTVSCDFDLDNAFWGDAPSISDDATLCVVELIWHIYKLFHLCEIDLNEYLKRFTIPNIIGGKASDENTIISDTLLIEKIYRKCNGYLWDEIPKKDFITLLNSCGKSQSFTIKKNQINRTKVVFRRVAKNVDKNVCKEWIKGIMENVFDGVEFMKSTLRTDKLSSGYSDEDVKFSLFLDSL